MASPSHSSGSLTTRKQLVVVMCVLALTYGVLSNIVQLWPELRQGFSKSHASTWSE